MTSLRIKPHLITPSCWGHFARERCLHFNLKNSMYSTRKFTWLKAAKDLLCTGVLTRQAREPITWNLLCSQPSKLCVKNLNWSVDFENVEEIWVKGSALVLPKCSLVLRRVMSRVSIPSTMDTSVSTSKHGGLDTTGTPNLNQCVRLKLKIKKIIIMTTWQKKSIFWNFMAGDNISTVLKGIQWIHNHHHSKSPWLYSERQRVQ